MIAKPLAELPIPDALSAFKSAADTCRACPIGEHATQAVVGEGPPHARWMLVGEQPGDREDRAGRPFVGPAGLLLNRAMADAGLDRETLYVTNAVKHFKYELRGKRRMHKTPAQREIAICNGWLRAEIDRIDPEGFVALGATAANALLGRPTPVLKNRGKWLERDDGRPVLITVHPSALLRLRDADYDAGYAAFVDDLRLAAKGPRAA